MSIQRRSREHPSSASIVAVLLAGAVFASSASLSAATGDEASSCSAPSKSSPTALVFRTSDSQFDPGVNNQGTWSIFQAGTDGNDNYTVGTVPERRAFFTFDLGPLDLTGRTIVSAVLQVNRGLHGYTDETLGLFDVSTDAATLNDNSGTSQAIFDDLGSGIVYGTYLMRVAEFIFGRGSYPLNQAGIAGITEAAGGFFSIGAALQSLPGDVFGATGGGDQRLVLCLDTDADTDGDGICDEIDNCLETANPDQGDLDGEGVGDACDDSDSDGVADAEDNCWFDFNPDQSDGDADGFGDACDHCNGPGAFDSDHDGLCDAADNCPFYGDSDQSDGDGDGFGDACDTCPAVSNPDQADADGNGVGDVCALCPLFDDGDGDNVCNGVDNCLNTRNPDQGDTDGDGFGDACDSCSGPGQFDCDGDGVCDQADNCICTFNPDQPDTDGDGFGDACDGCSGPGTTDYDQDGVCDPFDNCVLNSNPDQADGDGDAVGDVCDNCPTVSNADQADSDGNHVGDACALCPVGHDVDGDNICDEVDNCPTVFNPGQEDADGNGRGDVCQVVNDSCSAPTVIASIPFNDTVDTTHATPGPEDDLTCCQNPNVNSVWYALTPTESVTVTMDSLGSEYQHFFNVMTGTCEEKGSIACGINSITFAACVGKSYLIEVGGNCGFGTRILQLHVSASPLGDRDGDGLDDCADNCPLDGNPGQADADGDGFGDTCDTCAGPGQTDGDGDGVCDGFDNCRLRTNPDQANADGDSFGDTCDNCPTTPNYDQIDSDNNGVGDACALCPPYHDNDADNVCDEVDNCPQTTNPDQGDGDGDGVGDGCDHCAGPGVSDYDHDGVCDQLDNCLLISNTDQLDGDGDGSGDVCDNCPSLPNSDQADGDRNGIGDACALCPIYEDGDGDNACNDVDNCQFDHNPDQADADGDGIGDVCDYCSGQGRFDYDRDGVCDEFDNCTYVQNPDQSDGDGDHVGDVCDNCPAEPNSDQTDSDNNGVGDACALCPPFDDQDADNVCTGVDNCPFAPNPDQADSDGDGFGDACDGCPGPGPADSDFDGLCDEVDNCAFAYNPDQSDRDIDARGDACDNCPSAPNADQANGDGDALGDVCDPCLDDPTNLCVPPPPPSPASCSPLQVGGGFGWSTKTSMPVGRSEAAGVVIGDRVYVTHGDGFPAGADTTNQIYDRTLDTWYGGARAAVPRSELTAVCIEDATGQGLVFAVGGQAGSIPLPNVEIYDPVANSWSAGAPLPTPRRRLGAAFVPGTGVAGGNRGTVYVVGGTDGGGPPLAVNEAYDVQLGVWMPRASMPVPMTGVSSTTYVPQTGKVYVFGGFDGLSLSAAVQIYDPGSDTWSQGAPMPTRRASLISGLCGSMIYLIGGDPGGSTNEAYDPLTNTWLPAPGKPSPALGIASQSIATGREIFALGGRNPFSLDAVPSNDVFACGPCKADADCDDGLFCDGAERCDLATAACRPGAPPCDDGDACSTDTCDETHDTCAHDREVLLGTDGFGLFRIDVATGPASYIGSMGFYAPSLAADPTTGILYAGAGPGTPYIYTVDPNTAAATFLGDTGFGIFGASVSALEFDSAGTLYASGDLVDAGSGGDHLAVIDKATGAGTVIGAFGGGIGTLGGPDGIEGIAFDPSGTLYGSSAVSGLPSGSPSLYTIDVASGAATFVAAIVDSAGYPPPGGVAAIEFDSHGTLFGATSGQVGYLIRIDPATGVFTLHGPPVYPSFVGLTFLPCPCSTNADCDDGNACNGVEVCDPAAGCLPGSSVACSPLDQCHDAGICNPETGACSNPAKPDGTTCDDGDAGTSHDECQAGTCRGAPSCDITPRPKAAGYYKKLCKDGHGHPHGGDALADSDAVCVGQLTATFAGISTVDHICAEWDHDSHDNHHDTNGPLGKECEDKAEQELMALALNLCRQRVCEGQEVDSECSGGSHNHTLTTVSASLATADAILANPSRNKATCKNAKCLAKEVNNGHGLHHTSLRLAKEAGNKVRLSWDSPVMDDGSGDASSYTVWRRPFNSDGGFVQLGITSDSSFVDRTAATGDWEYEVTFTIEP